MGGGGNAGGSGVRYCETVKSEHDELAWPDAQPLYQVKADMFKGLAHPVRVRILELLAGADELPVADLLSATGLEPSHLSQHLAVLRRHRLVVADRRASYVYYRLATPEVAQLLTVARSLLVLALQTTNGQLSAAEALPAIGRQAAR